MQFESSRWDSAAASWCAAASKSSSVAGTLVSLKASCSDSWTTVKLPLGRQDASLVVLPMLLAPSVTVELAVQARIVSSLRRDVKREKSSSMVWLHIDSRPSRGYRVQFPGLEPESSHPAGQ